MDDIITFFLVEHGWKAVAAGFAAYLLIEGGLDIVTDLISHKIIKRGE